MISFKASPVNERPSVLIKLRLVNKSGNPLDPSEAWAALLAAFKDHKHFDIHQAEISPDKKADGHV